MHRLFVISRNPDDLETISSYLRVETKEIEHLVIAYLKLPQNPSGEAAKFDRPKITRDDCARSLGGFDFELIPINYNGDGLPSSAFLAEATERRCDTVVVVGAEKKLYSSTSLAASLVDESSIPVVVIKP